MKYCMSKKLIKYWLILVLPISALAQNDTTKNFNWKSFFGKNLNPGISVGIGGARPYSLMPQPTIKLGRIELEMSPVYFTSGIEYVFSAQLGVEILKLEGYKGKPAYLVASFGGFSKGQETSSGWKNKDNFAFLAGINQRLTKQSQISLKLGALSNYRYTKDRSHPTNYTYQKTKWYPYGEISYRLYALPFGERQFSISEACETIKQTDAETIRKFYSKYFNPRISFGVGVTHPALFGPTLGVKLWRLDIGVGIIHLGGEPWFSINGDLDMLKILKNHEHPSWITVGVSGMGSYDVIGSIHAGLKNYYKHGSLSVKIGIGIIDHYDDSIDPNSTPTPNSTIPTLDISYSIHLFKFRK